MRPKGNSNLRNDFWKDHPLGCTCLREASDLTQSLYERGSSVNFKESAQGAGIKINKDPKRPSGVRGWWAPSLHTIFLFSKTLGSSPHPWGHHLYIPLSHLPSHKTLHFFLSSRHYPCAPLLPYSSQLLPFWSLSLLHSRVPLQRGHFTCFWFSGFSLVLLTVGATLGIHVDHLALEVRGDSPYRTITIRGTVLGRLPPPNTRHCTDSRRNALIFLRKRSICLSWSFGLRVRLLVWHTSKGREMEYFLLYQ